MHAEPCGDCVELDAQIHVDLAEVTSFESALKMSLQLGDEPEVASGNLNVVNVNQECDCVIVDVCKVEIRIRL